LVDCCYHPIPDKLSPADLSNPKTPTADHIISLCLVSIGLSIGSQVHRLQKPSSGFVDVTVASILIALGFAGVK
jgi:hypothetical protein